MTNPIGHTRVAFEIQRSVLRDFSFPLNLWYDGISIVAAKVHRADLLL
jgi:hypothetical protein